VRADEVVRGQAELRNAVATIPLVKEVRIGGVEMHVEQYSV
jgi:hypothetical protein